MPLLVANSVFPSSFCLDTSFSTPETGSFKIFYVSRHHSPFLTINHTKFTTLSLPLLLHPINLQFLKGRCARSNQPTIHLRFQFTPLAIYRRILFYCEFQLRRHSFVNVTARQQLSASSCAASTIQPTEAPLNQTNGVAGNQCTHVRINISESSAVKTNFIYLPAVAKQNHPPLAHRDEDERIKFRALMMTMIIMITRPIYLRCIVLTAGDVNYALTAGVLLAERFQNKPASLSSAHRCVPCTYACI